MSNRMDTSEGGDGRRPRLTVISAEVPVSQSQSGFAGRLRRFLVAARRQMEVTLALIEPEHQQRSRPDEESVPADRIVRCAPRHPVWRRRDPLGQMLRFAVQYPLDPLPYHCYPRRVPEIAALLGSDPPDLIAIYLPYLAHLVSLCPSRTPVIAVLEEPWEWVVASAIGAADPKSRWLSCREAERFRRLYRRLDRRADAVVAISEEERAYFSEVIAPDKIEVIPHGIDTEYFRPIDASPRDIDVLVVGKLRAAHNLHGALRTWETARATEAAARWRWTFVGDIEPAVAAALRDGGCEVPGVVADVRPYYARARCVLVPALEGRGVKTTSLQAWAMGRPLVASTVGAQGLPARPGDNILVGSDPAAMVKRLAELLADHARARRLGESGRLTVERERDAGALADSFARLCLQILSGQARH